MFAPFCDLRDPVCKSGMGGSLKEYQFTVFFEPQENGFNVVVPAISEICTFGETIEEARAMAEDAIPKDIDPKKERLAIAV
jgi:hypothetical protein